MRKVSEEEGERRCEVMGVGKGGDYGRVEGVVMDGRKKVIEGWYEEEGEVVVIVGGEVVGEKYFGMVKKEEEKREMVGGEVMMREKGMGKVGGVGVG